MKHWQLVKRRADKLWWRWFFKCHNENVKHWDSLPWWQQLPLDKRGRNASNDARYQIVVKEYERRKAADPKRTKQSIIDEMARESFHSQKRIKARTIRRILESDQR